LITSGGACLGGAASTGDASAPDAAGASSGGGGVAAVRLSSFIGCASGDVAIL
jgi:hypothetical protein